ncbi:MAG: ABC transporter permease [Aeromicrobium sp.]|nr:MAG: ABC transporter permease [Aeromicrobium sp.]
MLGLLIRRDLKSRYKDSALGFAWTLIRPITQLAIYAIVIGKFLGAERGIPLFAIYIFTGLTLYTLFQEILTAGTSSILANASLVKKIYVPRELFPLASAGTALFNFCVQLAVLLVASALFGNLMVTTDLIYAVPAVLVVVTYGLAFAFLLSATNVFLRDIGYLVEILAMILMWASPILYSWTMVRDTLHAAGLDWLVTLYTWNPITLAVLGFQRAFYHNSLHGLETPEHLGAQIAIVLFTGLILLWLCHRVFRKVQGNFAQEL